MLSLTRRQKIMVLAVTLALAVPWTAAATPRAQQQTAGLHLLPQLWSALTGFWDIGLTPDDGCTMDPDGRCARGSVSTGPIPTPDSGCHMDPNGGCLPGS
jgi:hypothetical protein